MAHNGGIDAVSRASELDMYDSFPPDIKKALQDAPIQFGASTAWRFMRKGYDGKDLEQIFRDYMTGGEDNSTRTVWTYTIRKPGLLYAGLHDGKDHPQADRAYPYPNYQLEPRNTRVTQIRRARHEGVQKRRTGY